MQFSVCSGQDWLSRGELPKIVMISSRGQGRGRRLLEFSVAAWLQPTDNEKHLTRSAKVNTKATFKKTCLCLYCELLLQSK
jgi:hypothetical protein